jgi:Kef-type K+ transport system membrane component KefB
VGPHGFNLVHSGEGVRVLGELGVAFLMFIVGLEFSLPACLPRAPWCSDWGACR